jgi:hypothetical protein
MEPHELPTVPMLHDFVRHMDERLDLLHATLREGFARVDTRLTQVEGRLGHLDTRLDHMDSRFGQLDSRLERLDLGRARLDPVLLLLLGVDIATVVGMGLALWLILR